MCECVLPLRGVTSGASVSVSPLIVYLKVDPG